MDIPSLGRVPNSVGLAEHSNLYEAINSRRYLEKVLNTTSGQETLQLERQ